MTSPIPGSLWRRRAKGYTVTVLVTVDGRVYFREHDRPDALALRVLPRDVFAYAYAPL